MKKGHNRVNTTILDLDLMYCVYLLTSSVVLSQLVLATAHDWCALDRMIPSLLVELMDILLGRKWV